MNKWKIGFDKEIATPVDYMNTDYYIAGYDRGMVAKKVLDDIYIRTIALDDGNKTVVFAVVDTIGMAYIEVEQIRKDMSNFCQKNNVIINVAFTHNHSGPDTQGLWGKGLKKGRNDRYQAKLKFLIKKSIMNAVKNKKEGNLYFGKILTENCILDNRYPYIYDENLYRFRFVPDDGSDEVYIINFGCHPEMLGKKQYTLSADWPCYCGRVIKKEKGAEFFFINGAIGAITSFGLNDVFAGKLDGKKSMIEYGEKLGNYAISITEEKELAPSLYYDTTKLIVPAENKIFKIASMVKLIITPILKVKNKPYKYSFETEVGYLELGDVKIALIPGELFPELALGDTLPAAEAATGKDFDRSTLFELMGEGEKLIFGLVNDEIGYIIPENDFYLHPKKPYSFWALPHDQFGRLHYEETTCSGPYAAKAVWDAIKTLTERRTK